MNFAEFCKQNASRFNTFGEEVSLAELLEAREQRVQLQQQLLVEHQHPVLSVTLLAVGGVKKNPLQDYLFAKCLENLTACFKQLEIQPLAAHIRPLKTGNEALFCLPISADMLKQAMIKLEDSSRLARLWDLDVIDVSGKSLNRTDYGYSARPCLLCEQPAKVCARARSHSLTDIDAEIQQRALECAFAEYIGDLAYQALLEEAYLAPKPGLVDPISNGAHRDMTVQTFEQSAKALRPYFQEFVLLGMATADLTDLQILAKLRPLGIRAEQAMFEATNGVNTHKGAIFSFGLVCGVIGRLAKLQPNLQGKDWLTAVLEGVQHTTKGITQELALENQPLTAGVKLFRQYGVTGARGEAEQGFPLVRQMLPLLNGVEPNSAKWQFVLLKVLLGLMAINQDTNLLHRGGLAGLQFVQHHAQQLQKIGDETELFAKLHQFDIACIERNLSAGGSADLLALTIFFHLLMR